jgi:hypothetical protein
MALAPTREGLLKKSLDHTFTGETMNLFYCPQHYTYILHENQFVRLVRLGYRTVLFITTMNTLNTMNTTMSTQSMNTMNTHTECYNEYILSLSEYYSCLAIGDQPLNSLR